MLFICDLHTSVILLLSADSLQEKNPDILIIIGIVFSAVAIVLLLGSLIYCIKVHNQTHMGYTSLEQAQSSGKGSLVTDIFLNTLS